MGCQGEVYVVYGVQVPAKVEWARSDRNPVVYSINGHTLCDDEDLMGLIKEDPEEKPKGCPDEIEFYNGVPTCYYGASDMKKMELVMRVMGHSGEYGHGDMGSRHFGDSLSDRKGKALVGYVAGCESYWNNASEIANVEDIQAQAPRLIAEIKEKLGLDIDETELGLHLLFDGLNGY